MSPEYESTLRVPENYTNGEVIPANLPPMLLEYPQWVCWRYQSRGEGKKPMKAPVNPRTLGSAGVGWPSTWGTLEQALAAYAAHKSAGLDGIGFMLTREDPFLGVDIDGCIDAGALDARARQIMAALPSYTEVSPSGRGLRILVTCPGFAENKRTAQLELYSHSRFLTLTGWRLPGASAIIPVSTITIAAMINEAIITNGAVPDDTIAMDGETSTPAANDPQSRRPHAEGHRPNDPSMLWAHIFKHDRYGADHQRRFQGDLALDNHDHSLAVIRLLNCLARWTQGDATLMRQLMLQSPLANEKWFSRRGQVDWLDYQIANAIAYTRRK